MRRVLAAVLALAWCLGGSPASAHDSTITFTVVGDGAGQVRVAATWTQDGHLVDTPVGILLTATGVASVSSTLSTPAAQRIGPFQLLAVAGQVGVYETVAKLPAGRWTVNAESAVPVMGYGTAVLVVGAAAQGFPADFPPVPPATQDAASTWTPPMPPGWLALPTLIAGLLLVVWYPRRRALKANPGKRPHRAKRV